MVAQIFKLYLFLQSHFLQTKYIILNSTIQTKDLNIHTLLYNLWPTVTASVVTSTLSVNSEIKRPIVGQ